MDQSAAPPNSETSKSTSTKHTASPLPKKRSDEVHFVIQGKGGVGKSFVASILAEYFSDRLENLRCYDTDPVNHTFSTYRAFNVENVKVFDDGVIDGTAFDALIMEVAEPGVSAVIDNGATTFIPLLNYMDTQLIYDLLADQGKTVVIHTIVAGGGAHQETVAGFKQIAEETPESVKLVVWLNELHGKVAYLNNLFTDSPVYKKFESRVWATITMEKPSDLFAKAIEDKRADGFSFKQALDGEDRPGQKIKYNLLERQRLKITRDKFFDQLTAVKL